MGGLRPFKDNEMKELTVHEQAAKEVKEAIQTSIDLVASTVPAKVNDDNSQVWPLIMGVAGMILEQQHRIKGSLPVPKLPKIHSQSQDPHENTKVSMRLWLHEVLLNGFSDIEYREWDSATELWLRGEYLSFANKRNHFTGTADHFRSLMICEFGFGGVIPNKLEFPSRVNLEARLA